MVWSMVLEAGVNGPGRSRTLTFGDIFGEK